MVRTSTSSGQNFKGCGCPKEFNCSNYNHVTAVLKRPESPFKMYDYMKANTTH